MILPKSVAVTPCELLCLANYQLPQPQCKEGLKTYLWSHIWREANVSHRAFQFQPVHQGSAKNQTMHGQADPAIDFGTTSMSALSST